MLVFLLTLAHAAQPPDLSGTWALQTHAESEAKLPILGKIRASSETFALAEIRKTDDGWLQTHRACKVTAGGGSLVSSKLPPAFSSHLPKRSYPLVLSEDSDGWKVAGDWGQMVYGWTGDCAKIPENEGDPCVIDHDEDGHPGVTIQAKIPMFAWADIYLAQTNHAAITGRILSPDKLGGALDVRVSRSSVLGASNRLFTRDPPVTSPLPELSHWTMIRLADDATCASVLKTFGG